MDKNLPLINKRLKKIKCSGIRLVAEKAWEMEQAGKKIIHLEIGIPSFPTPTFVKKGAIKAIKQNFTKYTENNGLPKLRRAIAKDLKRRLKIKVSAENISLTVGGMEALFAAFRLVANPDDVAWIPEICWPNHENIPLLEGLKVIHYPLKENFEPDVEGMEKLKPKPKVILINTPSNPTGVVFKRSTINKLLNLAKKLNCWLISDESYESLVFDGLKHYSTCFADKKMANTIGIFSFSKTYAMTGWRVGFLVACEHLINLAVQVNENTIACVPSVSQMAALKALEGPQEIVEMMKQEYQKRRDLAVRILKKNNLYTYTPCGTFYILVDISSSGLSSSKFVLKLLQEKKVGVAPGITFGKKADRFVRICFAASWDDLREGLEKICQFIKAK